MLARATSWMPPTFAEYKRIMGTLTMVPMGFCEFEYLRLLDEDGPLLNTRDWANAVDWHIQALTKPATDKPAPVKRSFQLILMRACDWVLSHRGVFGSATNPQESSASGSRALSKEDSIESKTFLKQWLNSQVL
jgi:hypothetical protein